MRLQVHVYPAHAGASTKPTCSFLEVASPDLSLEDLSISICQRYRRLYPHRAELQIYKIQDHDCNDLDLSYSVSDVFCDKTASKDGSVVRVIEASNLRAYSIPPESALRSQVWIRNRRAPRPASRLNTVLENAVGYERVGKRRKIQGIDAVIDDSLDERDDAGSLADGERWLGGDDEPTNGEAQEDEEEEQPRAETSFQRIFSPELGEEADSGVWHSSLGPRSSVEVTGARLVSEQAFGTAAAQEPQVKEEIVSSPVFTRTEVQSSTEPAVRARYKPSPIRSSTQRTPRTNGVFKKKDICDFPSGDDDGETTPRPRKPVRSNRINGMTESPVPEPPSAQLEHELSRSSESQEVTNQESELRRLAAQKAEEERSGKGRIEQERIEQQRLEQQRLEQERLEQERLEKERIEQERIEQERIEQERIEQERIEQQRLEQQRLEQERLEKERIEQERIEQERIEQERLEKERIEQERLEKEVAEAKAAAKREEDERRDKEAAEARQRAAKAAEKREKADRERRKKAEQERLAKKDEQDLLEQKRAEEEEAQHKAELQKAEAEKKAAEAKKVAKERRVERARKSKEKKEAAKKLEEESKEKERRETEKKAQEILARETEAAETAKAAEAAKTAKAEAAASKKRTRTSDVTANNKASPVPSKKAKTGMESHPKAATPSVERDMGPPPVPNSARKRSNLKNDSSSQESGGGKKRNSVSFSDAISSSQPRHSPAPSIDETPTPAPRRAAVKRTPILCPLPIKSTPKLPRTVTPILPPGYVPKSSQAPPTEAKNQPSDESSSSSESEGSSSGSDSESEDKDARKPTGKNAATKTTGSKAAPTVKVKPAETARAPDSDVEMEDAPAPESPMSSQKALPKKAAPAKKPATASQKPDAPAKQTSPVAQKAPLSSYKSTPYIVDSSSEGEDEDEAFKPPPSAQPPKAPASDSEAFSETGSSSECSESESESEAPKPAPKDAASALNSLLGKKTPIHPKLLASNSPNTVQAVSKLSSLEKLDGKMDFDVREPLPPSSQTAKQQQTSQPKKLATVAETSESESDSDSSSSSDSDSDSDDGKGRKKAGIPEHKKASAAANKRKSGGAMGFRSIFSQKSA
ncbi:hypothetical protein FN846DRAFT_483897 [Sphaerosporella brunnea]|uniref:Nucleolar protein Dnt1-like N-terminal domain-containing protein n=1 Tax=Sphaerosporella brunnea TaxID=1250544 RepID=A0A5J5F3T1_9PEZI|nr:hypothetical protein FN846DRAFT_483897 [Sphaerosporella brunnea]